MKKLDNTMRMKNGPDGTLYQKIKNIIKQKYEDSI